MRPRPRLPIGLVPVVGVSIALIVVWEVAASLYFDANVAPQFRAGAISGSDPTVPAEMRVVQESSKSAARNRFPHSPTSDNK